MLVKRFFYLYYAKLFQNPRKYVFSAFLIKVVWKYFVTLREYFGRIATSKKLYFFPYTV